MRAPMHIDSGYGPSLFDFRAARRTDQFDRLALALETYDWGRQLLDDLCGVYAPRVVLTGLRMPVHDLPDRERS